MIGMSGRNLASDSAILNEKENEEDSEVYLSDIEVQGQEYY